MKPFYKILIFIAFVSIMIFISNWRKQKVVKEEFLIGYAGEVSRIRYDPKTIPFITVNGIEHYLGNYPIYRSEVDIQIGDSVLKRPNSNKLSVYKISKEGYYLFKEFQISD